MINLNIFKVLKVKRNIKRSGIESTNLNRKKKKKKKKKNIADKMKVVLC